MNIGGAARPDRVKDDMLVKVVQLMQSGKLKKSDFRNEGGRSGS
jgi:hypothetical protein